MKKRKIIIITFLSFNFISILGLFSYTKLINSNLLIDNKNIIKKYLTPFKQIELLSEQNKDSKERINMLKNIIKKYATEIERIAIKNQTPLIFKKTDSSFKSINLPLTVYTPQNLVLTRGIGQIFPGSAYIDAYSNRLFIVSATGILGYGNYSEEKIEFQQINSNINNFISNKQFNNGTTEFSIKDLKIIQNKVYLSFTNEIYDNCWNTSILYGKLNSNYIEFKPLFIPSECVNSRLNKDNEFMAIQSGGKISRLDKKHILLSVGDYRSRYLAQDESSVNGKIIKINIHTKDYSIYSKGHRNQQGLFVDRMNNIIIATEHGPRGGDEINLIKIENREGKIPNYGWPISSYGEHYSGKDDFIKYKKYPLYKSHIEYGFIEPIKYFTPSIAISDVISINDKKEYAISSLKNKSLFFIKLNSENQIIKISRFEIGERIRDMAINDDKLFLFMETTGSISVVELNEIKLFN